MDDADAFSELYRGEAEAVLIFLTRRTLDGETAVDLTAETFAIAMRSWAKRRTDSANSLCSSVKSKFIVCSLVLGVATARYLNLRD